MKDSSIKIRISGEKKEEWQEMASQRGISLSELIISSVDSVPTENVPTKEEIKDVPTGDVPTDLEEREEEILKGLSTEVSEEDLRGEILEAMDMGDGENWRRVKGVVKDAGYEWDGQTKELLKDGRRVWKAY